MKKFWHYYEDENYEDDDEVEAFLVSKEAAELFASYRYLKLLKQPKQEVFIEFLPWEDFMGYECQNRTIPGSRVVQYIYHQTLWDEDKVKEHFKE